MTVLADGQLFWITSRAAGVIALLAASAAVTVGLLMGGRMVKRRGLDLRVIHESLSLVALAALGVHALALLGDSFIGFSPADVAIPFASGYGGLWMAAGIVGGWMLLLLGLSYYARARIGVARWRTLHRFTALAWLLAIGHALGMGTDAGTAWFVLGLVATAAPGIALLGVRLAPASAPAVRA
jgi:sulfoxide reductase heme-binding subunit YedZ